jgi:hypothetical protein
LLLAVENLKKSSFLGDRGRYGACPSAKTRTEEGYANCRKAVCSGRLRISAIASLLRPDIVVRAFSPPFWHKPAVVVTENKSINKMRGSGGARVYPAKVEVLLDDITLRRVGWNLQELRDWMREELKRAVVAVPGVAHRRGDAMDINEIEDDRQLIRALQRNSQLRAMSGGTTSELSPA